MSVLDQPRAGELYRTDYYAWAQAQAQAIRDLAAQRWNGPLDLENLAEEVADLAKRDLDAVTSQIERIVEHLLKLQHSPALDPRRGWQDSVDEGRRQIERLLTPTLLRDLAKSAPAAYARTRRATARTLTRYGEADAASALPESCPWTLDQLLDPDFWPEGTS